MPFFYVCFCMGEGSRHKNPPLIDLPSRALCDTKSVEVVSSPSPPPLPPVPSEVSCVGPTLRLAFEKPPDFRGRVCALAKVEEVATEQK